MTPSTGARARQWFKKRTTCTQERTIAGTPYEIWHTYLVDLNELERARETFSEAGADTLVIERQPDGTWQAEVRFPLGRRVRALLDAIDEPIAHVEVLS